MQAVSAIPDKSGLRVTINVSDGHYAISHESTTTNKNRCYINTGKDIRITINGNSSDRGAVVINGVFADYSSITLNNLTLDLDKWNGLYGRGSKNAEIYAIGTHLLKQCKEAAPGVFGDFEEKNAAYCDTLPLPPIKKSSGSQSAQPAVALLSCTPDAGRLVAKSALMERYCCTGADADETLKDDAALLQTLDAVVQSGRPRALEMANFTVRFSDVSLSTLTHFARHRMQSIAIPSLTVCDRQSHIIPPVIKETPELLDLYLDAFSSTAALYDAFKAEGVSEDDLVYVLLSGNVIDFVTTMNARELRLFLKLRTCNRAQWEIRALATELLFLLRKDNPLLFARFGPSCVIDGKCPEGRMCCGQMQEMRRRFLGESDAE